MLTPDHKPSSGKNPSSNSIVSTLQTDMLGPDCAKNGVITSITIVSELMQPNSSVKVYTMSLKPTPISEGSIWPKESVSTPTPVQTPPKGVFPTNVVKMDWSQNNSFGPA